MSSTEPLDRYREANRARWDESVAIHAASEFYGVERFLAGESTLLPLDLEEVGGVDGKALLHLQCHFGLDTLSWAREGAEVVGVDFAPSAVRTARQIAKQAGISAEFVESELYASPDVLSDRLGSFDIVYVNLGAICWLPNIRGWARVCAGFLKPGGVLYLRDVHPIVNSLDYEPPDQLLVLKYPSFEQPEPLHWADGDDYADSEAELSNHDSYEWNHSLGEIVSAVVDAGCELEFLHEQDWTVYRALPWMIEVERGIWRLPSESPQIPLMFSLRARKRVTPQSPSALPSR